MKHSNEKKNGSMSVLECEIMLSQIQIDEKVEWLCNSMAADWGIRSHNETWEKDGQFLIRAAAHFFKRQKVVSPKVELMITAMCDSSEAPSSSVFKDMERTLKKCRGGIPKDVKELRAVFPKAFAVIDSNPKFFGYSADEGISAFIPESVRMALAHEESATKSARMAQVWRQKRANAEAAKMTANRSKRAA